MVPDALTDLLLRLRSDYATRLPPLYVTENGPRGEPIHDRFRIDYLDSHPAGGRGGHGRRNGHPRVLLLDAAGQLRVGRGTKQRFGLVNVDLETHSEQSEILGGGSPG